MPALAALVLGGWVVAVGFWIVTKRKSSQQQQQAPDGKDSAQSALEALPSLGGRVDVGRDIFGFGQRGGNATRGCHERHPPSLESLTRDLKRARRPL